MGQYTLIDEKCYKKWENTQTTRGPLLDFPNGRFRVL